jgi:peptidoglycan-associated lipoprotein
MSANFERSALASVVMASLLCGGCLATRGYVGTQVTETETRVEERVEGVETQVEENQTEIAVQGERLEVQEKRLDEMSDTAREALGRAIAAGVLAEGKLIHETVLTDEDVQFGVSSADLGDMARAAIADLANKLKAEDANIYIEIQGHTDSTGNPEYNLRLGERRAEAVRATLNGEHSIPLHRISVISYGETRPIADNSTAAGRSQNRRVAIVVLQ